MNEAPIPGLKQILAAKKKPATRVEIKELGLPADDCHSKNRAISTLSPVLERKQIRLNPAGVSLKDAAAKLVELLAVEGVCD
jgi:electron transfer flavoprotein beta subunit